jgi:hypothetical protein
MRKREGLGRALLVEYASTVATVVLSIGECKRVSTTETNVRIYPLRSSLRVDESRTRDGEVLWGKRKS